MIRATHVSCGIHFDDDGIDPHETFQLASLKLSPWKKGWLEEYFGTLSQLNSTTPALSFSFFSSRQRLDHYQPEEHRNMEAPPISAMVGKEFIVILYIYIV